MATVRSFSMHTLSLVGCGLRAFVCAEVVSWDHRRSMKYTLLVATFWRQNYGITSASSQEVVGRTR
jgi:hypothetical protein